MLDNTRQDIIEYEQNIRELSTSKKKQESTHRVD